MAKVNQQVFKRFSLFNTDEKLNNSPLWPFPIWFDILFVFRYYKETGMSISTFTFLTQNNRELKQQRRRRLQKRHWKSEFAPHQTLSRLFLLVYFVKCWQMFLELNSKGLYQLNSKGLCFVFPSSTKREFRHFHVVVGQRRQRNVQKKRDARAKLLFC